ncbi:MAG TPA: glycosyltransferase [Vicinamibacteria bacterium]|jgi:glycosyltransferase involved in cell wall biosynthesis|nr:glycosyltransferase [Vicinamibacteria bacterium]
MTPVLVLSPTPPDSEIRRSFQDRFGPEISFVDLPGLRRTSLRESWRNLRRHPVGCAVVTGTAGELRLFCDYLVVLAFCVPADRREVWPPGQEGTPLGGGNLVRSLVRIVAGLLAGSFTLARAWFRVRSLQSKHLPHQALGASRRCLYLKPTLTFGASVGGSVAHVSGVVNAFLRMGVQLRLVAAHEQALVNPAAEQVVVPPDFLISFPYELNQHRYQSAFLSQAETHLLEIRPDFIYQRYSLNDATGVILRQRHRLPLVLEFNGSEVWAQRHWGRPLRFEALAGAFERLNLKHADLVVVVSQALVEQAVSLGAAPERILFYPNCIDPAVFDPTRFEESNRQQVREALGIPLEADLLTFVGTFGQWHGTDVLAGAIRKLIDEDRAWLERRRVHFLLVGDGVLAPKVRAILGLALGAPFVTLAGLRPQADTPGILAASEILLSPHVPNPDGTPFFGSPTKLFEYMAMGKLILASDLDQIGWVLKGWRPGTPPPADGAASGAAALLVKPGSLEELGEGIRRAVEMPIPEREALGATARRLALASFTWDKNVAAVLARTREATDAPPIPPTP